MKLNLPNRIKSFFSKAWGGTPRIALSEQRFQGISTEHLQQCYEAGMRVQQILDKWDETGTSIIDILLNGKAHQYWEHYPWQGGIKDQRNHSQYFYHSHEDYDGEHGHFHTFYYHKRKLVHLVAIGLDEDGQLNKLYTFNCWGPGDAYYSADQLKSFLPKFQIQQNKKFNVDVHNYIQNLLGLFQGEIGELFEQRDDTFRQYREKHNGNEPYEDRSLEITSTMDVDVDVQIEQVKAELIQREVLPELTASQKMEVVEKSPAISEETDLSKTDFVSVEQRSLKQLQQSLNAGKAIVETLEALQKGNQSILELVMNQQPFEVWKMYPWQSGIIDKSNKSQYFYHSHPQSSEHGHFHTFYHYHNELVHLIVIALDDAGEPIELMTVNRWVTGDYYVPAKKLKTFLSRFRINSRALDRRVHQFVRNMLVLYQSEIQTLIDQREDTFQVYRQENGGQSPFEDRSLEVTSALKIDVATQVFQLEQELQRRTD